MEREADACRRGTTKRAYRLENWHETLTLEDSKFIRREAGDLLIELGYEELDAWVDA